MNTYLTDDAAKSAILDIGKRMYDRGYVAANDGNISVKVSDNQIWVTPTGVSKGFMTSDMLVKMNLQGEVLEGSLKPSSEVKMHLMVFNQNPDVQTVVHAHPPVATAFAVAGISLDKAVITEAVVLLGVVPVAPYALPGSQEVPESIKPFCKDYNAALLASHGALTWGRDPYEAYYRMESMEHFATIYMNASRLGNVNLLTNSQVDELLQIRKSLGITGGGRPTGC